jgi:hypothetical protein
MQRRTSPFSPLAVLFKSGAAALVERAGSVRSVARGTTWRSALIAGAAFVAASTLAPAPSFAQPAPTGAAATPSKDDVAKATAAFQQGTKYFQAKKFSLALEQFKLSYDTVASPNSHLYIARCQNEMGDQKEAFRTYLKVVDEAEKRGATEPKYLPTRDTAKTELDDLRTKIAIVSLTVSSSDPSARVKLGGAIVPKEDWGHDIPVDAGSIDVILEVPGQDPVVKKVTVQKGQREAVTLEVAAPKTQVAPPPPPEPKKGSKLSPLIPVGIGAAVVGVAGMTMFGVSGSMSKSTFDKLKTECGGERACPDHTHDSEIDKGRSQQTIANVGLAIGAVGLAASAGLFIGAAVSGKSKKSDDHATFHVEPQIGPGYAGVAGSF